MTPEVERIKQDLRDARSEAEIDGLRHRHRPRVQEMLADPDLRVMGLQIANLAFFRLWQLGKSDGR